MNKIYAEILNANNKKFIKFTWRNFIFEKFIHVSSCFFMFLHVSSCFIFLHTARGGTQNLEPINHAPTRIWTQDLEHINHADHLKWHYPSLVVGLDVQWRKCWRSSIYKQKDLWPDFTCGIRVIRVSRNSYLPKIIWTIIHIIIHKNNDISSYYVFENMKKILHIYIKKILHIFIWRNGFL